MTPAFIQKVNGQLAYLPDGVVLVGWTHYSRSIRPGEFDKMSGVITDDNKTNNNNDNNNNYYYFCYWVGLNYVSACN